jgi:mannose-6-phosphate isomerase-like protein (cupin superfamily)
MPVLGPGDGPRLTALGSTYTTKAAGDDSAGAYWLVEEEFWGDSTPLHAHPAAEEAFYVLNGQVAVWLGGGETVAGAGAFLLVPRGEPHGLRRLSDEPVRMLTLASPAGMEHFFAAVVREGEEALLADPDRLVELAAAHGTEILGDYPAS